MTKLKIAVMSYVVDNRSAKGSAVYARRLIDGLSTSPDIDLSLVHYHQTTDDIYRKGREVIMPSFSYLPIGRQFIRQILFFWRQRHEPFDIIHWCQPRLYPLFWLAPARKIAVTVHGGGDITASQAWSWSRLMFVWVIKLFHHKIDIIIADSKAAQDEIHQAYGIPLDRIQVIPIGGGEDYKPLPPVASQDFVRKNYAIDRPFILDVARLQPHKNVNRLIEAYDKFRKHSSEMVDLVIIGAPSSSAQSVYALAKNSTYASDIHFIDYVSDDDLNQFYSACLVFVFPSLNEGFGLPIVEAMAAGAPVITSNITSLPEVAGGAACLVDPYSIDDIAKAIKEVVENGGLQSELKEKGLRRASEFTWTKTVTNTIRVYQEVLSL